MGAGAEGGGLFITGGFFTGGLGNMPIANNGELDKNANKTKNVIINDLTYLPMKNFTLLFS
jgi:hypothetical protein